MRCTARNHEIAGEAIRRIAARTLTSEIYDFMNVMSGSLEVTAERGEPSPYFLTAFSVTSNLSRYLPSMSRV